MRATWSDWLASRTMRLHGILIAATTAAVGYLMTLDETDLEAFGVSPRNIIIALGLIRIASDSYGAWLRTDTTKPLAGRTDASDPMANVQDAQ